ncbi:MFS transporter [Clostridium massiliamazoniense]|uniref:MFS transporter n=1 Tax=Clostridium massiliamazoniense TaxID=1347366 RepID=UPI0006D837AB|nr:MFS transporter [Clostridium massiliamazoniense]
MKALEKIAILSISFLSLIATAAMAPALTGIQNHFLSASPVLVKLVITLPALICIPVSLLNTNFLKYMSDKLLIIIGLLLFLIGGICSAIAPDIYTLLITRGILGLGLGITAPMSLVLIGEYFEGKERAKFMGFSTASTNLGGIVSTLIVGVLANIGWRVSFLIYLSVAVVLLIVIFYLPSKKKVNDTSEKHNLHNTTKEIKLNKSVFKYSFLVFLALVAFYAVPTNMDFLIKAKNLGGDSVAASLVSLSTLSSLVSALLFGKFIKVLKKYYSMLIFILMAIGFALAGYGNNLFTIGLGIILGGYGFGSIIPYTMLFASNIVHKTHTSLAILIITTGLYLGEFVSPMILQSIANIIGMKNSTGNFYAAVIIALIALICSIYTALKEDLII